MEAFTPFASLLGGVLIGLAASMLLASSGRVAGISGIVGGLLAPQRSDVWWRLAFVAGLVGGGVVLRLALPTAFELTIEQAPAPLVVAGLLVGFGTRLGNGCTSGHGVCGISRGSRRSVVATAIFMATALATVLVVRHGVAP